MKKNLKNLDELTEMFVRNYKLKDGKAKFKTYRAKVRRALDEIGELNRGVVLRSDKTNRKCAHYSEFQVHKLMMNDTFYDYLIKNSEDERIHNQKTRKQLRAELDKERKDFDERMEAIISFEMEATSAEELEWRAKAMNEDPTLFLPAEPTEEELYEQDKYENNPLKMSQEEFEKKRDKRMLKALFEVFFEPFNEEQFEEDLRIVQNHQVREFDGYEEVEFDTVETAEAKQRLRDNTYCIRRRTIK